MPISRFDFSPNQLLNHLDGKLPLAIPAFGRISSVPRGIRRRSLRSLRRRVVF